MRQTNARVVRVLDVGRSMPRDLGYLLKVKGHPVQPLVSDHFHFRNTMNELRTSLVTSLDQVEVRSWSYIGSNSEIIDL